MKKIALVTCRVLPEPDADQELLVAALTDAGFEVSLLAWDNPAADPADHDLCVLRSTWDYYKHAGSFLKWIERADKTSRLMNPGFVVRWNYHKRYLGELASAGVPVVPTALFERGEEAVLKSIMEHRKWDDVVVKPSVSASSFRTKRFTGASAAGQDFLRGLLKDRDAMVQQYMPSVEGDEGERAIVYVDGEFTHAVRKSPRFSGSGESVSGALEISDDERTLAEQTLAKVRERLGPKSGLLYARVDVVRDPEGQLRVSEVELIEPSLYLAQYPPALERLVAAIEKYSGETMPTDEPAIPPPKARPTKVRPVDVRKPFGRAPDPPTAADWEPKGGKARYRKPRGESAGKWRPTDEKLKVWSPEGDEAKPWKPTEDRGEAPKREGGKPGEWKPRDKKPGEWKARGEKSTGWKPRGDKPTGWKPRGEKPGEWKPRGGKPGEWKPRENKPGEWKPRDKKPGEWKPRGEKSEGWKPRGDKPTGGWKPRGEKPGEWKPRENKPGEWKPRDKKPGEWKPRENKPGEWKPRGDKPTGWKPRGEKPGEWKPRGGKPGEWKPRDKKPGEWKPRENKPGEWKPRGDKPAGWKPREGKPGEWKPRDKKPGEWKPRGEKPGGEKPAGWKPRSGKPGEWKPRGPRPPGGKPGGAKFTGRKPPRRPPQ